MLAYHTSLRYNTPFLLILKMTLLDRVVSRIKINTVAGKNVNGSRLLCCSVGMNFNLTTLGQFYNTYNSEAAAHIVSLS